MSAVNPAAPTLRRASLLLHRQARTLERDFSIGGVGRIWPKSAAREQKRRDELRSLALSLKQLSAAFGRFAVDRRKYSKPILEEIDG